MSFEGSKSFFNFSKGQRKGVFFFLFLIVGLQLVCCFVNFSSEFKDSPDKIAWISLQSKLDTLKMAAFKSEVKIYPFNPNFITDYKGYKLGMSVKEIDRLLVFRKENKYVNSASEFQRVTQVSDSLLLTMSPFFKFPGWVGVKKSYKQNSFFRNVVFFKKEKIGLVDINLATQEDLVKVFGIGEVIALRILKQKETLGGFVSMEQMKDVWGLSPEVVQNLNARFNVFKQPHIKKIPINTASLKEISQFPYFKYSLAKEIVMYRSMYGDIKDVDDLIKIRGFPVEKYNIIALYLEF
jgi:DNA uptake protein ComE-like DNA-binding protein